MTTWGATVASVLDTTGATVTNANVLQAGSVIEIYCNRTEEASGAIGRRDLHWLQTATEWQAAWLAGQVGYETKTMVSSISQDGVSAEFGRPLQGGGGGNREFYLTLAPLAARALKNLSWKGSHTKRVLPASRPPGRPVSETEFYDPAYDDEQHWQAL